MHAIRYAARYTREPLLGVQSCGAAARKGGGAHGYELQLCTAGPAPKGRKHLLAVFGRREVHDCRANEPRLVHKEHLAVL